MFEEIGFPLCELWKSATEHILQGLWIGPFVDRILRGKCGVRGRIRRSQKKSYRKPSKGDIHCALRRIHVCNIFRTRCRKSGSNKVLTRRRIIIGHQPGRIERDSDLATLRFFKTAVISCNRVCMGQDDVVAHTSKNEVGVSRKFESRKVRSAHIHGSVDESPTADRFRSLVRPGAWIPLPYPSHEIHQGSLNVILWRLNGQRLGKIHNIQGNTPVLDEISERLKTGLCGEAGRADQ